MFCQALMVSQYPRLQCFPVAQPDGGRDALSPADGGTGAVVFQVKFKREDQASSAEWMIKALEGELAKIRALITEGASEYVMVTNARGTAHPEAGRIDRVQEWMNENITVPAQCLWRDDLDARLDAENGAAVKLSYPSILTGDDAMVLLVQAQLGPEKARLARAIRSFVAKQFDDDQEVKFRQVDLANSLLALFVDVPVDVGSILWNNERNNVSSDLALALQRNASRHHRDAYEYSTATDPFGPNYTARTADLLLDEDIQRELPWIVLQGAPGQGKSTLAQYVSQVHRARFLDKKDFLRAVPEHHAAAPFKLPVKIDLRDLSGYLENRPYLGISHDQTNEHRTMEGFVAKLISIKSGSQDFSVTDLYQAFADVPILFFLDGLDEVADLSARKRLVDRIGDGLNRLKESGADLQVVVTSRPTLFGKAPALPKAFARLTLAPIGLSTINEYTQKWIIAKALTKERADEVMSILAQKLDLGYIRELTRSPMQLTIVLGLIYSVGYSLPDIRTDLYRKYVELFMTRESEKSQMVRDHQALLLEIVEHLAWKLQSEAESDRSAGSIGKDELRELVLDYIERGEHGREIIDDLFDKGLERIYVLVQRIDTLYEFEVQPLREYFAAKYLYTSAPLSNFRHEEVHGDRSQRFEAIAANPYWANVARFYAGFYQGAELASLSMSLRELISSKDRALGVYARGVGAALLTDWVFRSKKAAQNEVLDVVFDSVGIQLAALGRLPGFENGVLDAECGRGRLARHIFDRSIVPSGDRQMMSSGILLSRNGGDTLTDAFTAWIGEGSNDQRALRINQALVSGALESLSSEALESMLLPVDLPPVRRFMRMRLLISRQPSLMMKSATIERAAIDSILDWSGFNDEFSRSDVNRFASLFSLSSWFRGASLSEIPLEEIEERGVSETRASVRRILSLSEESGFSNALEMRGGPRDAQRRTFVAALDAEFGDRWATCRYAILTAGLLSSQAAQPRDGDNLYDEALKGRAWRGNGAWWRARIESADGIRLLFWVSLLLSWGTTTQIRTNLDLLEAVLETLSEDDMLRLVGVVAESNDVRISRGYRRRAVCRYEDGSSSRLVRALRAAFDDPRPTRFRRAMASDWSELSPEDGAALAKLQEFPGWSDLTPRQTNTWLSRLEDIQHRSLHADRHLAELFSGWQGLSLKTAWKIVSGAANYPHFLTDAAYVCLLSAYEPVPARAIAQAEGWTFD